MMCYKVLDKKEKSSNSVISPESWFKHYRSTELFKRKTSEHHFIHEYTHRLWSRGGGGRPPPHFLALGGQGGAHHFELQPLVCIVFSGKVITLTQQCITKVIKVTTNSRPPTPSSPRALCAPSCSLHSHYAPPHFQSCSKAYDTYLLIYLSIKTFQSVVYSVNGVITIQNHPGPN